MVVTRQYTFLGRSLKRWEINSKLLLGDEFPPTSCLHTYENLSGMNNNHAMKFWYAIHDFLNYMQGISAKPDGYGLPLKAI